MNIENPENLAEDDVIAYEENDDKDTENNESELEESSNIPLSGSPLYPRIYVGDSAKPLMGQFNQSEYTDDNITRTWTGILTSFYG